MSAATTLEELAERADDLAAKFRTVPTLDIARGLLNEAGVPRARNAMFDAFEAIGAAQEMLRRHQDEERVLRERRDLALTDAEWDLGACFEVRANKQWLVRSPDGTALADTEQRSLTADEKKAWIAAEAAKAPDVRAAGKALRDAEMNVSISRDEVSKADRRFSACKHDLDASVATLNTLREALPARSAL